LGGDVLRSLSAIPILAEASFFKKEKKKKKLFEYTKRRKHKKTGILLVKDSRLSRAQLNAFEFEYSGQNSWYSLEVHLNQKIRC
jgi:hypothetical protein